MQSESLGHRELILLLDSVIVLLFALQVGPLPEINRRPRCNRGRDVGWKYFTRCGMTELPVLSRLNFRNYRGVVRTHWTSPNYGPLVQQHGFRFQIDQNPHLLIARW